MTKAFTDDAIEISFPDLVLIVESKMGGEGQFDQAHILYYETNEEFVVFFSDGMWRYKARISKQEINVEQFRVERLSNATKIFM